MKRTRTARAEPRREELDGDHLDRAAAQAARKAGVVNNPAVPDLDAVMPVTRALRGEVGANLQTACERDLCATGFFVLAHDSLPTIAVAFALTGTASLTFALRTVRH